MKRSRRLLPVLQIAELEARKAGQALVYMQQKLQSEEHKKQLLEQHLAEYRADLQRTANDGMNALNMRMYQQFIDNIDQAIVQQTQQIEAIQGQLEQVRQFWQARDIRCKSLEKMIGKIRQEELGIQARQEQKNHDDFAQRARSGNTLNRGF